ncbi:MAG: hypothetical protein ABIG63_01100 [Chloroflexota bacterium]
MGGVKLGSQQVSESASQGRRVGELVGRRVGEFASRRVADSSTR